ncbi:hypothetical protein FQZ97_705150 [compost metagenome]
MLLGLGAEDVEAIVDQGVEVELHVVQLDLAGLQLGDVEDLVDQGEQFVAGAVDGLHVVALLGRQRGAEEQFGHAQHAVHRGADLVADLGEEFTLGLEFGGAGGQGAAGAEGFVLEALLAFAQGHAEEHAADGGNRQQGVGKPVGLHLPVAEQRRQGAEDGDAEHPQGQAEQPRRAIAMAPVVDGEGEHAEAGDGGQHVDQLVELQLGDDQQEDGGQRDQHDLAQQQAGERRARADLVEEAEGEGEGADHGGQHGQVGDLRLCALPVAQPGRADAQQADAGDDQAALCGSEPEADASA